jgi:hypothetical protein
MNFQTAEFRIDGRTYSDAQRGEILNHVAVSASYLPTLGVPILRGRNFTDADREGAPLVAIVSEAMARRFWPDGSAVGRTMTLASTKRQYEIVGISADYKVRSIGEAPTPYVHFAVAQRPASYNTLIARTTGDADATLAVIRRELRLDDGADGGRDAVTGARRIGPRRGVRWIGDRTRCHRFVRGRRVCRQSTDA